MQTLIEQKPLDPKHRDHKLIGNYTGSSDCHIEPDWILIYTLAPKEGWVRFERTGTHSDLFTPMLHKLSSRNAPEARRWRLAQENLDEAYVHRTLSPDFLSKSSDSGFWSKRQRFRPKVYATLGFR